MGRKKLWAERILVTMAEGITAKIDALLHAGETRLDFIRLAIGREIRRRSRQKDKNAPD